MAFADPQSLTISGTPVSVTRTGMGINNGTFASADGLTGLSLSHQTTKANRKRHTIRVDTAKIAADPLLAGVNVKASMTASLTIDVPSTGYTLTEAKAVADALVAYLTTGTGANVAKLLGNEI